MLRLYVNAMLVVLNIVICINAYEKGDLQFAAFAALLAGVCALGAWMSWLYVKFLDSNGE